MKQLIYTFVLLLFSVPSMMEAQNLVLDPSSKLSVSGTSTLHDWECNVEKFNGKVVCTFENGEIADISDFKFDFEVTSLDSGKNGMDKKMYEALKESSFPEISYEFKSVKIDEKGNATFTGTMFIAGVKKEFTTPVKITCNAGDVRLTGKKSFNLSDFNIEAPTALLGTIKTGEEVTIHYDVKLNKVN
ncbi:YceI family protein [Abyssalbus ytuae]|uniref:YceI family protein n=1 Tax=Abyssalbus ytuae TaxID=2926907 RepID=A0A9E7D0Z4_9FLAO|nr:YceI family protein [Abyssalbus ytuae]UOB18865.1 YceI family protein [Abyssalbus ytuae]